MMNAKVCDAIIENIREFNKNELSVFWSYLAEEISDPRDLCDCIMYTTTNGDDIHLDTIVRDQFFNAYLKMHTS